MMASASKAVSSTQNDLLFALAATIQWQHGVEPHEATSVFGFAILVE